MSSTDDRTNGDAGTDRGQRARERRRRDQPAITAHDSDADHTVFTEDGNTNGWIATDLVVEAER
jgi:hypothetical protein